MSNQNLKFVWDKDTEDPNIKENGKVFMWVHGGSVAVQRFVEALSKHIRYKCDWDYIAGQAHIDVLPEGLPAAKAAVMDEAWMAQFIVPHTDESAITGTYFNIMAYVNPPRKDT